MVSMSLEFDLLRDRAKMLGSVRAFFAEKGVLEVDTPILSKAAPVDAYIDVMRVEMGGGKIGYLHTSPEYGLKKLLSRGSGDIYQLGHVFRAEEESPLHSPEFTMLEWYRIGMPYIDFIEETLDLLRLFLGDLPSEILTYREALIKFADVDLSTEEDLYSSAIKRGINVSEDAKMWDRDALLTLLFSHLVEPELGKGILSVITDYPASQAALAKTAVIDGIEVAMRFEIYYRGIELANGFDELTNAIEQRSRFEIENQKRIELGKEALPIDEEFLEALERGIPECCGVAVGFDRLMMLRNDQDQIQIHP